MASEYYTVLTDIGKAKQADYQAGGPRVELATVHVGTGGGASYYDDYDRAALEALTGLVDEVWSDSINHLAVDNDNPNWVVVEGVIPTDSGGWMVREVGIKDTAGDLIAVGRFPPTYKPALNDGAAQDLLIRSITEWGNADAVTIEVDPAVALASRGYVQAEARASYIDGAAFASDVSAGDAVYWDDATGEFALAIADGTEAALVRGLADTDTGRVYREGLAEGLLTGLTAGEVYYLSDTTPGALTTQRPATPVRVGQARGAESLEVGIEREREQTHAGDPNGALAAHELYERAWDTSGTTPVLYLSTEADGTTSGTTWTPAGDVTPYHDQSTAARHRVVVVDGYLATEEIT